MLRQALYYLLLPIRALFAAPGRLFASGKRVWGISLPMRVAIFVALFLIISVISASIAFLYSTGRPFAETKFHPSFYIIVTVLVLVIPWVVYHVVRLWLEGDLSPFEDIEKAWNAGLAELKRQGLDLSQIPVFLIVGSQGEGQEKALFDASRLSFSFREVPPGPSALHWYANAEGAYIVLTRVGCLSQVAQWAKAAAETDRARPAFLPMAASAGAVGGTIVAGREDSSSDIRALPESPAAAPAAPPYAGAPIGGTMMISSSFSQGQLAADEVAALPPMVLAPDEALLHDRRLEYFSQLLRRHRQPVCPHNGLLFLVPYELLQRNEREAAILQQVVARDLSTLQKALRLRTPATVVVTGLEEESGFRELVRRVGRDRAVLQRFGKGFSLTNPPLAERLEALTAHACGAFEDWIYNLFREKGSLNKPGNAKLYALLAKIRHQVRPRLENLLATAFGADSERQAGAEAPLFSGCYFAATGETEDRQAFVKSVLAKLAEEQGELQWTRDALLQDRKHQSLAQALFALDFVFLVGLGFMLFYQFMGKRR